jgi:hypothetical protein
MTWGPNTKKLVIHKVSLDAIPKGGGVADGIKFLSSRELISKTIRAADEWVKTAILAIRQAAEPNPFREATDEEIAGEILKKIEERKVKHV